MKKLLWLGIVRQTFLLVMRIMRVLPLRTARNIGAGLGTIGYWASKRYRQIAERNLTLAYGAELTPPERRILTRRVFQHFGRALIGEFLKAPSLTTDDLRRLVQCDTYEPIHTLLQRGKGVIIVTAHFGNWELMARRSALEGFMTTVIARQGEDAQLNALTDALRANGGYEVHPRGASPRLLLQRLKQNRFVAILPDQKSDDVFVPFFGELAGTVAGPAVLALKTGAAIVPMFCPRQPDGTYRVVICPEIDTTPTGDTRDDTRRIMTDINCVIENMVRRYPDQWLWLHDRWRLPSQEHPTYDSYLAAAGRH